MFASCYFNGIFCTVLLCTVDRMKFLNHFSVSFSAWERHFSPTNFNLLSLRREREKNRADFSDISNYDFAFHIINGPNFCTSHDIHIQCVVASRVTASAASQQMRILSLQVRSKVSNQICAKLILSIQQWVFEICTEFSIWIVTCHFHGSTTFSGGSITCYIIQKCFFAWTFTKIITSW